MHAMPQVELHNHYMNKNKYARKCNLKYMIHLEEMKCLEIYSAIKKTITGLFKLLFPIKY